MTVLLHIMGSGEELVLYVSLAMTVWLVVGYRRLFGGLPTVNTPGEAVRAFLLALCWPAAKDR